MENRNSRSVSVRDLQVAFDKIIELFRLLEIKNIKIDEDFYRFIPASDWNTFESDVILLGSLYDDIDSIHKLVGDKDGVCSYADLDRLAYILIAISEKLGPTK